MNEIKVISCDNFILRVVIDGVEDLDGTGKWSVGLQVGHGNGGVRVRHGPAERRDLGANGGAVELASGSCLHEQIKINLELSVDPISAARYLAQTFYVQFHWFLRCKNRLSPS